MRIDEPHRTDEDWRKAVRQGVLAGLHHANDEMPDVNAITDGVLLGQYSYGPWSDPTAPYESTYEDGARDMRERAADVARWSMGWARQRACEACTEAIRALPLRVESQGRARSTHAEQGEGGEEGS